MSSAQRRLFLQSQTAEGDRAYHLIHLNRIRGRFDEGAARAFAQRVLSRHEALRSSFHLQGGEFVAEIHSEVPFCLSVMHGSEQNLQADLKALLEHLDRPFDLSSPPLLRSAILQLSPTDRVLATVCHHLIFDGFSASLIGQELEAELSGQERPPATRTYRDFAAWETEFFASEEYQRQRHFWLEQFSRPPERLALRHDFPHPGKRDFRGASLIVYLPTLELRAFSRAWEVTPFHLLLTAFFATLHALTGQRHLTLGTLISPRESGHFQEVVGLFANSLPLSLPLDPSLPFSRLLEQVRTLVREAMQHADFPFEHLVSSLPFLEPNSRNPLFDVVFNFERNAGERVETFGETTVETLDHDAGVSMFDLSVDVVFFRDELRLKVDYSTSLFRRESIAGLMDAYRSVLHQAMQQPDTPLNALQVLSNQGQERIRVWNSTARPQSRARTFLEIWRKQVARVPDNPAVRQNGRECTYSELEVRAEALAQRLEAQGLGHGDVVAVALERSPEWITSLLALWKVGAVYLPLDSSHPRERLGRQLADSETVLVLTEPDRLGTFAGLCPALSLQQLPEGTDSCSQARDLRPEDPAYLLYTSGSTGNPKGVVVQHQALGAHLEAIKTVYRLRPDDNVLQFASIIFDASLEQVLVTLAAGACLILPPPQLRDPKALLQLMADEQVSVAEFPPAYLRLLAADLPHPATATLRRLLSGGDTLPPELARDLTANLPRTTGLVNIYGPTEATMAATAYLVGSSESFHPSTVPIGRPLPNTRVHILDQALRPLPPGMVGELCLSGDRLAQGYLNDPALTAQRFPMAQLADGPERIYRTGDQARWLDDGNLEFLGRMDRQVQLRGLRIELGEIEDVLRRHPSVADALALKIEEPSEHLAALVVLAPQDSGPPDAGGLQPWLAENLPAYMLPSTLRIVERIARSADGKADLGAAAVAVAAAPVSEPDTYCPPEDGLEREVWEIWSKVLGTSDFGRKDRFFRLGGHSLSAIEVMVALRERLKREIPLALLLGDPTLQECAQALGEQATPPRWLVPLGSNERGLPLKLLIPGLGGSLLDLRALANSLSSDFACLGVELPQQQAAEHGIEVLAEQVLERLSGLEARLQDGYLLGHSFGGYLAFELTRRLEERGLRPRGLVLLDVKAPNLRQERDKLQTPDLLRLTVTALLGQPSLTPEHGWDGPEAREWALAKLQQAGRFPRTFGLAKFRRLLDVLASRAEAFDSYAPKGMVAAPIHLVRASELSSDDPWASEDGGWSSLTTGGFQVETTSGTHFSMLKVEEGAELASRVLRLIQFAL